MLRVRKLKREALVMSSEFPPGPGGIGNHAFNLCCALARCGWKVAAIVDSEKNKEAEKLHDANSNIEVVRVSNFRFRGLLYLMRVASACRVLWNLRKGSTVIASGRSPVWLLAFLSFFFRRFQYLAVIHGSEVLPTGMVTRLLTKWSLRRFDKIVSVSSFTDSLLSKLGPNFPSKVINNGYDVGKFGDSQPFRNVIPGAPVVLTVGSVTYRKGQQNVIKCLPMLVERFPGLHYHIAGLPVKSDAFHELAVSLGVDKHITFHGAVHDAKLLELLDASDVFIMLSDVLPNGDVEGFGIAIIEANSRGLPAIGSSNSGIRDAIKDGFSGRLVHPRDSRSVLKAMSEIMSDYDAFSDNSISWSKQFDWDVVVKTYVDYMSE